MGTRGTLKVYLNGELKIRQYNQWDSDPCGQFKDIRDFMSDPKRVRALVYRLKETRFATLAEWQEAVALEEGKGCKELNKIAQLYSLTNRDYGADILWQMLCLCNMSCESGGRYILPDWCMVFDEYPELEPQEGNYEIELTAHDNDAVHFRLLGEYHGKERAFGVDWLPTDEEIEAWEKEGE